MGRRAVDAGRVASGLCFHFARSQAARKLRVADASTGEVRDVMEEVVPTQYESGRVAQTGSYSIRPRKKSYGFPSAIIGASFISTIATTGQLKIKSQAATGPVTQLLRVDEKEPSCSTF